MANVWQQTVKRVAAKHPGKSLKYVLPLAKMEYKKMGLGSSSKSKKGKRSQKGGDCTSCHSSGTVSVGGASTQDLSVLENEGSGSGPLASNSEDYSLNSLNGGGKRRTRRGSRRRAGGKKSRKSSGKSSRSKSGGRRKGKSSKRRKSKCS